jgi:hypothetical protein
VRCNAYLGRVYRDGASACVPQGDPARPRPGERTAHRDPPVARRSTGLLDAETFRFIKASLPRRPATSLETALQAMLESLPVDLTGRLADCRLVAEVQQAAAQKTGTLSALRVARNNLAHGIRGYDPAVLNETVILLELVVRAQALRVLGCPDEVLRRVLKDAD